MDDQKHWDWALGTRVVADLQTRKGEFEWREEFQVSPNGERIAAVVKRGDTSTVCVSGDFWDLEFEKIWYLRYSPDGRLTALVLVEDEWTLVVDEKLWPNTFTYLWGTTFDRTGENIAAAVQQEMRYGMVCNGRIWESLYQNAASFTLSPSGGSTAAVVQTVSLGQADIETFAKGCYSLAVDGRVWERDFVNLWTPVFDQTGTRVAAQVRTSLHDYTIAVDGKPWSGRYPSVWEPCFDSQGRVLAPVRPGPGWAVARDGELICKPEFTQLWGLQAMGDRIYSIVAPRFGRWTVAVDCVPWRNDRAEALDEVTVHPDRGRVAARAKLDNRWTMLVDERFWGRSYEMIWGPVFSPDGLRVATKVENNGIATVAVDDLLYKEDFDQVWEPVFGPDGDRVLIRAIKGNEYRRIVARLEEFTR
jgi:hypothetical protein